MTWGLFMSWKEKSVCLASFFSYNIKGIRKTDLFVAAI